MSAVCRVSIPQGTSILDLHYPESGSEHSLSFDTPAARAAQRDTAVKQKLEQSMQFHNNVLPPLCQFHTRLAGQWIA